MAEITIAQKHTIKARAEPFTLTVEIDLDHVSDVVLEFHRAGAGQTINRFVLVEADLAALEDLCAGAREQIKTLTERVRGELRIEPEEEFTRGGRA